ncbi:MAG: hypothetical protein QM723_23255 [Myxococcaceae bacterium]
MGGEVSGAKLRPVHHHQAKGAEAKKTDAAQKPVAPPSAPPAKPAGAGDAFQTAPAAKPPLADGNYGVSNQKGGLPSASGRISDAEWADPAKLMAKLTQYPHGKRDTQSEATCGPSNVLGAAMLSGGPDAAAQVMKDAASSSTLTAKEKTELTDISDRVKGHTATFEDLNKAQELMYRSAHTRVSAGDAVDQAIDSGKLKPKEVKELKAALQAERDAADDPMKSDPKNQETIEKLVGKAFGETVHVSSGYVDISAKRHATDIGGLGDDELGKLAGAKSTNVSVGVDFLKEVGKLAPGQALTVRLGAQHGEVSADHYVTVGRRKDGSFYIYNPDPSKGDATLSLGKDMSGKFLEQLQKYEVRQKRDPNGSFPQGIRY